MSLYINNKNIRMKFVKDVKINQYDNLIGNMKLKNDKN